LTKYLEDGQKELKGEVIPQNLNHETPILGDLNTIPGPSVCKFWHHKIKFAVNGIRSQIPSIIKENLTTTPSKFYSNIMIFIINNNINNINNMNIILII